MSPKRRGCPPHQPWVRGAPKEEQIVSQGGGGGGEPRAYEETMPPHTSLRGEPEEARTAKAC